MKENKLIKLKKWLNATTRTNAVCLMSCMLAGVLGTLWGATYTGWLNGKAIHDWAEDNINDLKEKFG